MEKLNEIIYQQNQTLLTAQEGILLGRDRTRLYTAHKFKLGKVSLWSKAFFKGAQYDTGQRLAYQVREKDILAQAIFKNIFNAALQVYTEPWWRLWRILHLGECTRNRDEMNVAYLVVHHLLEPHHGQEGLLQGLLAFMLGGTGGQATLRCLCPSTPYSAVPK